LKPITVELLAQLSRKERPELLPGIAAAMNEFFPKYDITTEKRIEHFLAQALHEADGFRTLSEYASGDAYDTRTDLGNTPQKDGDGRKYKGRGIFQTTGKTNYRAAGKAMGIDAINHPELLATPRYAVWSACIYWQSRKLNEWADRDDIRTITRKINGGYNGLDDRVAYLYRVRRFITA
jgi:putative chitinase